MHEHWNIRRPGVQEHGESVGLRVLGSYLKGHGDLVSSKTSVTVIWVIRITNLHTKST